MSIAVQHAVHIVPPHLMAETNSLNTDYFNGNNYEPFPSVSVDERKPSVVEKRVVSPSKRRMSEPIHSRGTGRSGPKRKTGCLTCRRRKVRCDEARPVCANCIRLRLDCGYVEPKTKTSLPSPLLIVPTTSSLVRRTLSMSSQNSHIDTAIQQIPTSAVQIAPAAPVTSFAEQGQLWSYTSDSTSLFPTYEEPLVPAFDNFDGSIQFTASNVSAAASYPNIIHSTAAHGGQQAFLNSGIEDGNRRRTLLDHFVQRTNPLSMILPTDVEWMSACHSLVPMANDSSSLLYSICALSSMHRYATMGDNSFGEAFQLYQAASREVENTLDSSDVSKRQVKAAFATIYLLMNVEVMAQSTAAPNEHEWPLRHLQSVQHRMRQYSDHLGTWSGMNRRILTWSMLLQTKAEWNTGYASLHYCSADLIKHTGDPYSNPGKSSAALENTNGRRDSQHGTYTNFAVTADHGYDRVNRKAADIVYDTLNQPGVDFFINSQAFTSRIVDLNKSNHQRGTPEAEYETLKSGQSISSDLHALYINRPNIFDLLEDPSSLSSTLSPKLAKQTLLNLRVYLANFFAQFIHLHRVAFGTYPATGDVDIAVVRVITLARAITGWPAEYQSSQSDSSSSHPSASQGHTPNVAVSGFSGAPYLAQDQSVRNESLPATMLWPLFLAALECGVAERLWILQAMRDIDVAQVPNAPRTIFLLKEILRRQDQFGGRVDYREVRRDIFDGDVGVIF